MKTILIAATLTVSAIVLPPPTITMQEIEHYIDIGALELITDKE